MKKNKKVIKSAATGRFVSTSYAKGHPSVTFRETVPTRKQKKKRR